MFSQVESYLVRIFFILALFPFVSFGTNSMDSQPFYIFFGLISLLFLSFTSSIFKEAIDLISLAIIVAITIFLSSNNLDFIFVRAIASYLGFFIALIVSIIYFQRYGVPSTIIFFANVIYLLVAILQFIYGPLATDFLVIPNGYPNLSRGAISLTPEHTYFGIVLYFFCWINFVIYDYHPPKSVLVLNIINLLSIVFLAKSSMVIVFLIVTSSIFLARNWNKKFILKLVLFTLVPLFLILYIYISFYPEARFARLVGLGASLEIGLIDGIIEVIRRDGSINDRVLNAIFPYFGFVQNYGMPGGIDTFYEMSLILVDYFNGFFWSGLGSNKILSFIGAIVYELGFVGIIVILYIFWLIKDGRNPNRIFELILLFVILHSAIAIAFSLVPILIAIMYVKKNQTA